MKYSFEVADAFRELRTSCINSWYASMIRKFAEFLPDAAKPLLFLDVVGLFYVESHEGCVRIINQYRREYVRETGVDERAPFGCTLHLSSFEEWKHRFGYLIPDRITRQVPLCGNDGRQLFSFDWPFDEVIKVERVVVMTPLRREPVKKQPDQGWVKRSYRFEHGGVANHNGDNFLYSSILEGYINVNTGVPLKGACEHCNGKLRQDWTARRGLHMRCWDCEEVAQ